MLNLFGASKMVALVVNNNPEERQEAVEFMSRMPYTFTTLQADVAYQTKFEESAGAGFIDTVVLDKDGQAVYSVYPDSRDAIDRTIRVLKLLMAHEGTEEKS